MLIRGWARSRGTAALLLIALCLGACGGTAGQPLGAAGSRDRAIHQKLDTLFRHLAAHGNFSGAVLLQHGSQIVYRHAFGYADRERGIRNTLTTRFNLGSVDKMFTAVAIMQLVQAGKVSLHVPISRYLPDYPQPAGSRITVEELLTHTSGLGDYFQSPGFLSTTSNLMHPRDYFPYIVHQPPAFTPGARFQYSNSGFIVLGAIVEAVSGQSYFQYLQQHVFDVAHMTGTGFYPRTEHARDLAIGYTGPRGHRHANTSMLPVRGGPAGGGYSTAPDLVRFATALLDDKLLDRTHTDMLTAPHVTVAPQSWYGYGFMSIRRGPVRIVGHTGGAPGISAYLLIYLGTGYTAAILSNFDPSVYGGPDLLPAVSSILLGRPPGGTSPA
jgi:CubicO group peptidase (beta-lactamase class C family)